MRRVRFPTTSILGSTFNAPKGTRPISTVTKPTTIDEHGQVTGPGHIAFVTSESERQRFPFLAKVYGHTADPSSRSFDHQTVAGKFPSSDVKAIRDKSFKVGAFTKAARPLSQDRTVFDPKPEGAMESRNKPLSFDHGEMSEEVARALHAHTFKPIYEVSGVKRANCVHGWYSMATGPLRFKNLPQFGDHLTPQGAHAFAELNVLDRGNKDKT